MRENKDLLLQLALILHSNCTGKQNVLLFFFNNHAGRLAMHLHTRHANPLNADS